MGGSLSRKVSVQRGSLSRGVSVRETPPPPLYGYARAVRILLECILVLHVSLVLLYVIKKVVLKSD